MKWAVDRASNQNKHSTSSTNEDSAIPNSNPLDCFAQQMPQQQRVDKMVPTEQNGSTENDARTVSLHDLVQSRSQLQHEKTHDMTDQQRALIGATLRENKKKRKRKRDDDDEAEAMPPNKTRDTSASPAGKRILRELLFSIPDEVWTIILLYIPPIGSYYNLCLVNKRFYESFRYNEIYWEQQCLSCLKLTRKGVKSPNSNTDTNSSDSDMDDDSSTGISSDRSERHRRLRRPSSPNHDGMTRLNNPDPKQPLNSWYDTFKQQHVYLLKPRRDGNWVKKANNLADRGLFFYALYSYKQALRLNPTDPFTTACIGDLYYKNYLHKSSYEFLRISIEEQNISPRVAPWAFRQLSHLYRDALGCASKNINQAIRLLKTSIEQTDDVDAMYELGDLFDELRLKTLSNNKGSVTLYDTSSSEGTSSPESNGSSPSSGNNSTGSSSNKSVNSTGSASRSATAFMDSGTNSSNRTCRQQNSNSNNKVTPANPENDDNAKQQKKHIQRRRTVSNSDSGSNSSQPPQSQKENATSNTKEAIQKSKPSLIGNGNGNNSSDSQANPKSRARKDRLRSIPIHSSRSAYSSDYTSSESPEPDEKKDNSSSDNSSNNSSNNGNLELSNKYFKTAVYWFEMAANHGDTESMFELANMYPDTSPMRANWLQKAGDLGHKDALNDLAVMHELGQGGIQRDLAKSFTLYQASATAGSVDGMCNAGLMYEFGKGIRQDFKKSMEMYKKAARYGSSRAMKNIGVMYELGRGTPRNYAKAVKWYRKAAEQMDTDAMLYLGTMAASGRGMPRNYRNALLWFRSVLNEHQDVVVYPYLAYMYMHGYGTKKNVKKALKYLHTSAYEFEDATGQYMLGEVFHIGIPSHLKIDRSKAKFLFEKSAKQDDHDATLHLSYYLYSGIEFVKAPQKSEKLFEQVVTEVGADRCIEIAKDVYNGENMYLKDEEYANFIWAQLKKRGCVEASQLADS